MVFLKRYFIVALFMDAISTAVLANDNRIPCDLSQAIQAAVNETSYDAVWQTGDSSLFMNGRTGAYMAPNRRQNYRIYFTPDGVHLCPRVQQSQEWNLGLHFHRYGCNGQYSPVHEVQPHVNKIKIIYNYNNGISEWYINKPEGLEQGFTIKSPINNQHGNLEFEFRISGNLHMQSSGNFIAFIGNDTTILRLEKLHAFDSQGTTLTSCMSIKAGNLIIKVNDTNAVYPITIDPVIQSEVKLMAGEYDAEPGDTFARTVSVSGDTVVIGNPYDDIGNSVST